MNCAPGGGSDARRTGNQSHFVSGCDRRFRNRVSHFPRGTIADEANGIDRFARRAGGDDKPHAIKLSWRASRNSARKAMSSTFHKRPTPSYPQASIPSSGPMNSTPRAFKCFDVFLRGGVFPHFAVHGRRHQNWRARRERDGCQRMTGQAMGEFGDDVGRRRRDQKKVGAVGQVDMSRPPVFFFIEETRQ